jgi:hypothetical protein
MLCLGRVMDRDGEYRRMLSAVDGEQEPVCRCRWAFIDSLQVEIASWNTWCPLSNVEWGTGTPNSAAAKTGNMNIPQAGKNDERRGLEELVMSVKR